jgi:hypothetical protein
LSPGVTQASVGAGDGVDGSDMVNAKRLKQTKL